MEEALASGMAKLAKTEHPITVPRHKHTLPSLREEAVRLERALTQGEQILVQAQIQLPAFLPFKGLWRRMLSPFNKPKVETRQAAPNVIRAKLDELKETQKNMAKDMIEGILTPMTLADDAECNAYYFKTRRHLDKVLPQEVTEEGQQARYEALEFTSNAYLLAKRVECALKESDKRDGNPFLVVPVGRALTAAQAHKIDPRLLAEIWLDYKQAFELSEDELGK